MKQNPFSSTIILLSILTRAFIYAAYSQPMETVIQQGHPAAVTAVAFSPDGNLIATGSKDKTVKLWETSTGNEVRTLAGHASEITDIHFTPDGKYLLSSNWDHTVKVWEILTGRMIRDFTTHQRMVKSVTVDEKGTVFSAGAEREGYAWDMNTGDVKYTFRVDPGQYGPSLDLSPDGKYLAVGNDNGRILILNTSDADTVFNVRELEYSSCGGCYTKVIFSRTGKYFLSAANRGPMILWSMKDGSKIRTLVEKQDEYASIAFSPDENYALSADEKTITLWNLRNGKKTGENSDLEKTVNDIAVSPDGKFLLSGGNDNKATLWEIPGLQKVREFTGLFTKPVDTGLDLDPDDYWQSLPYQIIQLKKQFELSPDGNYLVKGYMGTAAQYWSWKEGRITRELKGHTKAVLCFDYSPNGKYLVTGGGDKIAILWNASTGDSIRAFKGHTYVIFDVRFSHDGKLLATGGYDGTARIWDVATGKQLISIRLSPDQNSIDYAFSVSFTPNDLYLVTGSLGKKLTMWEIDTGEEYRTFTGHTDVVSEIRFLPDGKSMISSSWDHSLKCWDYRNGFTEKKFAGHEGPVNDFDITPDGKKMISASTDRSLILWDVDKAEMIRKFVGHTAPVTAVRFSRNGRHAISEGLDGVIKIWDLESGEELASQFIIRPAEWLITNPSGYFYSQGNVRGYVHFVKGTETYETGQFFEQFYRPDIMENIFSSDRSLLPDQNISSRLVQSPPPSVEITYPDNGLRVKNPDINVLVKITNNGGGIDEVKLMHNGKRLPDNREGVDRVQSKGKSLFQTYKVALIPGLNTFGASAFSKGRVESKIAERTVMYEGKDNPATCYAVIVGINKYVNPAMSLNYARADAEDFAKVVKANEGSLFSKVNIFPLYDSDASRENILNTLDKISTLADPSDVFIFYYAGHGSMAGNDFYFIPVECTRLYEQSALSKVAIEDVVMQEKFRKINALKQVVIMDACQSGGSVEMLAQRGAANEKAIAQLSRSAGVHIMASAGSEQFASEYKELKHGIFTYVLLQAMEGKADGAPADGQVTMYELKSYLDAVVPELSEKYKGKSQYPYTFSRGHDFPISLDEDEKK